MSKSTDIGFVPPLHGLVVFWSPKALEALFRHSTLHVVNEILIKNKMYVGINPQGFSALCEYITLIRKNLASEQIQIWASCQGGPTALLPRDWDLR